MTSRLVLLAMIAVLFVVVGMAVAATVTARRDALVEQLRRTQVVPDSLWHPFCIPVCR